MWQDGIEIVRHPVVIVLPSLCQQEVEISHRRAVIIGEHIRQSLHSFYVGVQRIGDVVCTCGSEDEEIVFCVALVDDALAH